MCGRFTLFSNYETILERFEIEEHHIDALYVPNYNIAPTQRVVTVIHDGKKNKLGFLKWGLVSPWAKDLKVGYKMINARAETIADKPSFRHAFNRQRCLIVADSFYEWKNENGRKIPMRIKLKTDEPFGFAGIWETWRSQENEQVIHTCAVITTSSNELMAPIHERMPVILRKEDEEAWLNIHTPKEDCLALLKPLDAKVMEVYEVSADVNSPRNNRPELIQKVG